MPYGHASHQIGLDADVWFRLDLPSLPRADREDLDLPKMVDPATKRVDPRRFTNAQAEMVRIAATDLRVGRIFVNPAIKLALCEREWTDRSWLRIVRPWYGHDAHFHVRLNCPADQSGCISQEPPPPGDGCGEEVMSWLTKPPPPPSPKDQKPKPPPPMPAGCAPILNALP
jgi:penicillin-insensitive murein endopeptidase